MRMLIAATCSAGVAVVLASPAIAAAPPPTVPSDAAIAQYVEAVPSATGPVATGGAASPASGAALSTALRAKVERAAGADAPALLQLAQDPRFGTRPESRAHAARAIPRHRANPAPSIPRHPVLGRRWLSRPAGPRRARSLRRPRRPVPAGSCSSRFCSRDHGGGHRCQGGAALAGRAGSSARTICTAVTAVSKIGETPAAIPTLRRRASRSDPRLSPRPRGGLERWGRGPSRTGFLDPGCVRRPERGRVRRPRPNGRRDSDARPPLLERRRDRNAGRPRGSGRSGVQLGVVDRQVVHAVRGGLKPILNITNSPRWARGRGGRPARDVALAGEVRAIRPRGGEALQRHVHPLRADGAPAARAVLGGVERAERRKQPRAPADRRPRTASPAHYRKMVNAFAGAVHAVASGNEVVAGTLGPFGHDSKDIQVVPPMEFMSDLLCVSMQAPHRKTCSARTRFDIWAHNAYANGGPDWKAKIPGNVSIGELPEMRALLLAAKRQGTVVSSGQPAVLGDRVQLGYEAARSEGRAPEAARALGVGGALPHVARGGQRRDLVPASGRSPPGEPVPVGVLHDERSSEYSLEAFRFPFVAFGAEGRRLGLGTHTLRQARRGDRGAQDREPLGRSHASPCRPLRHLLRPPRGSAARHDCIPCPARRPRGVVDPVLAHGSADAARRSIRVRWQHPLLARISTGTRRLA